MSLAWSSLPCCIQHTIDRSQKACCIVKVRMSDYLGLNPVSTICQLRDRRKLSYLTLCLSFLVGKSDSDNCIIPKFMRSFTELIHVKHLELYLSYNNLLINIILTAFKINSSFDVLLDLVSYPLIVFYESISC